MKDEWIEKLRAEHVDTDPRPGFKDELRTTIIAERNGVSPRSTVGGHRRVWLLGAVAACVGLLIGGLVVFGGDDQTLTPSTVPEPGPATTPVTSPSTDTVPSQVTVPSTENEPAGSTVPNGSLPATTAVPDVVVTDTQAISLDEFIDPAASPVLTADIVGIDRQTLPTGWVVSGEDGRRLVYSSDMAGYSYTAAVTTDDQMVFDVTYSHDPLGGDPCALPVAGFPGTVGDLTGATVGDAVCGETTDGNGLAVVPTGPSNPGTQWSALDVADALAFVAADDIPHPDLAVTAGSDEPAVVDLAGTLNGARWAVTAASSSTRRIDLYIAGKLVSGTDVVIGGPGPPRVIAGSGLTGVPGYGAIASGRVEGEAVTVIVTLADGRTARLPTSPFVGGSAFAVPIPDSVDVVTLTFIADDGSVLAVADVPNIPVAYGGGPLDVIARR